jgi:hypothetical protein
MLDGDGGVIGSEVVMRIPMGRTHDEEPWMIIGMMQIV